MIANNDKGISGFWTDHWDKDGCGNENVLSEFDTSADVKLDHIACPYDSNILFPSKGSSGSGCFFHCKKGYLTRHADIRKEVLTRFLANLKNHEYDDSEKLSTRTHPFPEIITKEEIDEIERRDKIYCDQQEKEYDRRKKLEAKTKENKLKSCIVFNGNNLNPIPKELFELWSKISRSHKYVATGSYRELDLYRYSYLKDYAEKAYIFEDNYGYDCETICFFTWSTSIGLCLYRDETLKRNMFSIIMSNGGIDMGYFEHPNELTIPSNVNIKAIYNEFKELREKNKDKYNEPYKETSYERLQARNDFLNAVCCETCLYTEHCNRLCCPFEKSVFIPKEVQFKVNLHILEPCNYRCRHCFAHFDNHNILPLSHWKHIVDNCANGIFTHEFNIAGGEPLLYKDLHKLVKYINLIGCDCSIITNGFTMDEAWVKENAEYYSTIGFSIDSFCPETMIEMGRATTKGEYLSKGRFAELCKLIRQHNPKCKIKVNTVVTDLNKLELVANDLIDIGVVIDRWKIFKMDIFKNDSFDNSDIAISDKEYHDFVEANMIVAKATPEGEVNKNNHSAAYVSESILKIIVEKDVNASYLMVDANGFLVDDSKNDSYVPVINCATEDFFEGFKKISFDQKLYFSRYT